MYLRSWINLLTMAEAIFASLIAINLYKQVRKYFNSLDAAGSLPIERKEIIFFAILFFSTMLFSVGKVDMAVLWMHIGNLVFLSFLAYTDFKTKLLDVPILVYLLIQNVSFFILFCFFNNTYEWGKLYFLCAYIAAVVFCCMVKAVAKGDGFIYLAMLPAILIMENPCGIPVSLLFLLLPLFLFLIVESGKAVFRKSLKTLLSERKPFAPYLLAGYIISFWIYVKGC